MRFSCPSACFPRKKIWILIKFRKRQRSFFFPCCMHGIFYYGTQICLLSCLVLVLFRERGGGVGRWLQCVPEHCTSMKKGNEMKWNKFNGKSDIELYMAKVWFVVWSTTHLFDGMVSQYEGNLCLIPCKSEWHLRQLMKAQWVYKLGAERVNDCLRKRI